MAPFKKVTVNIPSQLFELGLSETQVHGLTNRWLVISLFQENKITAAQAGEYLSTDRAGFLKLLDEMGILYEDGDHPPQKSPVLARSAETSQQVQSLTEALAQTKYELYKVKQKLAQANKVRNDFISTVSHELRTPLNSIIGFAKLMLNQQIGPLNEVQHTDLSIIYDSAKQLLSMVNDILDLSKIDAGKIRLEMGWMSVEEIVVGVIASTYMLVEDKPIELREEIAPRLPQVYVDRARIRQVVINLLSNAAKFTDSGTITLRIHKLAKNGQDFVCFSVIDTGIGIDRQAFDQVFEPFRQIDSSEARRAEGTGLGLAISYRLVKLHGGDLWVESTPGRGSTFSFILPVEPPPSLKVETLHADYRLG